MTWTYTFSPESFGSSMVTSGIPCRHHSPEPLPFCISSNSSSRISIWSALWFQPRRTSPCGTREAATDLFEAHYLKAGKDEMKPLPIKGNCKAKNANIYKLRNNLMEKRNQPFGRRTFTLCSECLELLFRCIM